MPSTKRYWQDLSQLDASAEPTPGQDREFNLPAGLGGASMAIDEMLADKGLASSSTGRRDFLKFLGFSLSAATLAACETPVIKSIPYVNKPEEITPGVANWYASTFYDGEDYASVLVKTREGRPIHVKGNTRFGINHRPESGKGAVNARINSSVLPLYDSERLKGPMTGGKPSSWDTADKAIASKLVETSAKGGRIVVLSSTVISPSTLEAINTLRSKYGASTSAEGAAKSGASVDHVQLDTISMSGLTAANAKCFGKRVLPSYDLTKADVIVSLGADFLSNWGSTTENTWQYATRRRPEDATAERPMSRHWQVESRMSITGANADQRIAMKPSQIPLAVIALHDLIAKKAGATAVGGGAGEAELSKAADELWAARGKSVVFTSVNDEGVQTLVNSINWMLGNYGSTIDLAGHTFFKQGDDAAMQQLVTDMKAGKVDVLLIAGVNPVYSLHNAAEFKAALAKVGLSVSFSGHADETASACTWCCPDHNWLESWNDFMPKAGHYALAQPTISPLFSTRQWPESLLRWSGVNKTYHDHIQDVWRTAMTSRTAEPIDFTTAWNQSLHNGVYNAYTAAPEAIAFAGDVAAAGAGAKKALVPGASFEVLMYTKESIGSGSHAGNPWLQEMPDPLSKVTWDNYVCIAPSDLVALLGWEVTSKSYRDLYIGEQSPAHEVKLVVNGIELVLPALPSPGQAPGSLAVALGYGRGANGEHVGRAACMRDNEGNSTPVGKNAYPLTRFADGSVRYTNSGTLELTGQMYALGLAQTQLTAMDRHSVVKETSFTVWAEHKPKETYNHQHSLAVHSDVNGDSVVNNKDRVPTTEVDLWAPHPVAQVGHRWGMTIDLNSCIGCGACITACNSENNVSVVGKDEVRRSRDMHWMRLDRYYSSDMTHESGEDQGVGKIDRYLEMEVPSATPKVIFMPVMCQHCNHAPCETVCPVAATTHSNEGLNQMTYNRCIGTRYCANNCPYKVRRFNWFNYVSEQFGQVNPAWDDLGRMVLNPDVTVRSRGVIEKCSLCVQQIQLGKYTAKKAGTPVKDGDIQTACSAGCPTSAITFGDLNDNGSRVKGLADSERSYHMLEEIGVQPNINYLVKVRNTDEAAAHHA